MKQQVYRDNGAIGALLDEYENSLKALKAVIHPISDSDLAKIVDTETKDKDCVSIQSILNHVVRAGYNYVIAIRNRLGEELPYRISQSQSSVSDYHHRLDEMFLYNIQLFEDYPKIQLEEKEEDKKVHVSWGQKYDVEQLFEHAIVHVMRHRRQIERFIIKLESSNIASNSQTIYSDLCLELQKTNAQLVAVSKTKPASAIQELYDIGQRIFGENRVQEMVEKHDDLPKDIEWHMIGHLQKNKVKYMGHFVNMIHSVDNLSLVKEINKQAAKHGRVIDILLQIKIASEESKTGWDYSQLVKIINEGLLSEFHNIRVCGVMGMATFTDNKDQVLKEFKQLKIYFDNLKEIIIQPTFKTISMGMSGDYELAIAQGSNMVRIGSLLFGSR